MKNKLNGRDFITIGIFNAIGIVIYMAVAFAMATTVIGGFIASGVSFMVAATVYILMAVKVKKKGVFTISGTLLGLIALSGGHLPHAVFAVIGGMICDLIIGNYESKGTNDYWIWDICISRFFRNSNSCNFIRNSFFCGKSIKMENERSTNK